MPKAITLHRIDAGSGPAIVLLHGLFGSAANLGLLQRHLQDRFRVISMDLRNHGASPHQASMQYADLAADVGQTLEEMGVDQYALIGHSMGGKVAMRLALAAPRQVTALSVLDIAPTRYLPAFRRFADAMQQLRLDPPLTRRDADAALADAIPDAKIRGFLLQNLRLGPPTRWRIGLQNIIDALPDIEDWPEISGQTYHGRVQFIAGDRSDYIPTVLAAKTLALFPTAQRVTIGGAGHWLHADNPHDLLAALDLFHTRLSADHGDGDIA